MPVFFYLKHEVVNANIIDHCYGAAAERLRQHYQPDGARAGHGKINITRACSGTFATRHGAISPFWTFRFSLVFDTLLLPLDASHGPYTD